MPETVTSDVIIVGAGPAGATAGHILSRAGLKVLMIDKRTFPRKKLCAGVITHKTIRLLERIFREPLESLKEKNIIDFESRCYEMRNKHKTIAMRSFSIPLHFIDRERYDDFLLQKAIDSGARFTGGDGVKFLDVLHSTVTTESGKKYKAEIIIGADGVNSKIRRSFFVDLFGRGNWAGHVAAAHEIFIPKKSVKQIDHPMLFFGYIDFGYAWVFPGRDDVKIGMFGLKKRNTKDVLTAFKTFISALKFPAVQDVQISSYVLPYGCYLPSPAFRNILLVGDAAGFADPLFGEGIYYAQRSAELASHAIAAALRNDRFHQRLRDMYIDSLCQHIFPEFDYANKIRTVMFKYLKALQWYPLMIVMKILGDMPIETIHGIRSWKWMRKKASPNP